MNLRQPIIKGTKLNIQPPALCLTVLFCSPQRCGGRFSKRGQGKGGAGRFCWILQDFEEEGVTVEGNGWRHLKEGQKLGGGAHQGRSGWSGISGVKDFFKEAPDLEDVPTEDFDLGVVSTGIPLGGIPISSKEWTNHKGVVSDQVQITTLQLADSPALAKATWPNLDAIAKGIYSNKGGWDGRNNLDKTEDNDYCPFAKTTTQSSSGPTRRLTNPIRGAPTTSVTGWKSANQTTSASPVPPPTLPKANPQRLESSVFTHYHRLAIGLLLDTHYRLAQGIRELIRGNPTERFMELAAVSHQIELEMTEMIKEMSSWLEHLELNGMVPYEAWNGSKGK
ncbi:hypothetical protein BY996DRAFT_6536212 [Phakopsora pachyrhizi]|nr:hypothetical protein BY996DRAFT_6536212 [Phakopsora pachyrhizi]